MYFESVRAVLEMDGHGPFVWSAYIISLIVVALLVMAPYRRRRRLLAAIRRGQHQAAATGRQHPEPGQGTAGKEESLNAPGA